MKLFIEDILEGVNLTYHYQQDEYEYVNIYWFASSISWEVLVGKAKVYFQDGNIFMDIAFTDQRFKILESSDAKINPFILYRKLIKGEESDIEIVAFCVTFEDIGNGSIVSNRFLTPYSIMSFGKYSGYRYKDIPLNYWKWYNNRKPFVGDSEVREYINKYIKL